MPHRTLYRLGAQLTFTREEEESMLAALQEAATELARRQPGYRGIVVRRISAINKLIRAALDRCYLVRD